MKRFIRYALECLICFILVKFFDSCNWFSADNQLDSVSNQMTQLYRDGEFRMSLNLDKEPYDTVRDGLAREMYTKVRILCWIMTTPKNHWRKARHIKNTWGNRCNRLIFISTETDNRLPTVKVPALEGYDTLWGKTREAFRYIYQHHFHEAEWFLKADDDSFVILENLRFYLSNFNTSDPFYFGHKFKAYIKSGYMQGGSGYVLSKEALRRFVEIGLENPVKCNDTEWPEDVQIGICMENLDCKGMDTRDSYGRDRFLPISLETHLTLGIVDDTWLWEMHPSFYPVQKGFDCCSDTAIGFHQLTPNQMYLYYYLIYRVNAYGIQDIRTEIQSKPQLPPDVNFQALPFSGPSTSDLIWTKRLKKREKMELEKYPQSEPETSSLSENLQRR
ncbi:glycoprotein-N-acetylgalactosamine 3-beta-galactosyltransferase 1-like isoform X2 [Daphnia pulex]|uniref:glycoprotein-N-acetylgalactosamine 3-beta-galactosyltransferase 1-like isoform X2 n=1 Tax=Daphnia pulex TaxID=6669 RepID=UPI001EDE3E55|nr:glycoprotein-N-acetylgalactosamine 3-beta-galactosyltransferase 1-like isoform X2 [Daphnia pulex]